MVVTPVPFSISNVVALTRAQSSEPRPAEAVLAELRAENERHADVLDGLLAELAGAPLERVSRGQRSELRQTRKKAAGALCLTESRLARLIARYHRDHPNREKLAVQPAGNKYARWIVYTNRVKTVIDSGAPY